MMFLSSVREQLSLPTIICSGVSGKQRVPESRESDTINLCSA